MISRKIQYSGNFTKENTNLLYEIIRNIDLKGELHHLGPNSIELRLEGDPSMIKLLEHQIQNRLQNNIEEKVVTPIPFKHYKGLSYFINS